MSDEHDEGAARLGRPFGAGDPDSGPSGWELIARSMRDYMLGDEDAGVLLSSDAEEDRILFASHFFRGPEAMPLAERRALELARGTVLDVGAGAGAHALALQACGVRVTATEVSTTAVEVMVALGVEDARLLDVFAEPGPDRWDTVLILMNGTTLVGSPAGLTRLLAAASARLAGGGRILIDSSDLRQERVEEESPGAENRAEERGDGRYVGEVQLQVTYKGERSPPFPVLYAHPELLAECAREAGLESRVVAEGEDGAYLAELTERA